ncbi:SLATT domain-containing protein [Stenotrophomonas acidaminiphila]|uniref:SLATT domain-containing protein n=1 Tax=Stenotrophomonas acidaminiphila TaxID=128780 RepID=UPI003BF324D8
MKDNIWFTYKARIKAHERLEWMDFHSQLLLVWYSILVAVLATLTIRHPNLLGNDTDILSAILSIGLLAISLCVANRDFRGRAMLMRSNYQNLHKLHRIVKEDKLSPEELESYSNLLKDCENHRTIDDILARMFSTNLTSRVPTRREHLVGCVLLIRRYLLTTGLYVTPLLVALYFARKS